MRPPRRRAPCTSSAPSAATASCRAWSRTVAVTVAPACVASCTPAVPTPPAAPLTSTRSPICELGLAEEGVVGGGEDLGKAAGLGPGQAVGHGQRVRLVHQGQGCLRPAADHGHDAIAGGEERHLPPHRRHLAGELHARDVGGPAGRRWIEAGPLHQVRRIQPRRPHRHQKLGVARGRGRPAPPRTAGRPGSRWRARRPPYAGPGTRPPVPGRVTRMALYDIPIHTLQGDDAKLGDYKGKTLLLVNVASKCGLTPQYEGLERLQKTYGDRGFSVIGFPCNQFMGQEPGTSEEIAQFCSATYGVTFPLMEKIEVNGEGRHPDLRRADGEGGRRGRRRRHHVELREVPRVAQGRCRGALPAPGGAGGCERRVRHRGAADRLTPPYPVPAGFTASIFDMDGLLIDSEILWHEAEIEILGGLGVPLAVDGCRSTKGMFVGEVTAHWYALHPWPGATPTPDEVAVADRRPGDRAHRDEGRAQAGRRARHRPVSRPWSAAGGGLVVAVPPHRRRAGALRPA